MKNLIKEVDGWEDLTAEQIRSVLVTSDPQRRPAADATWDTKGLLGNETFATDTIEALTAALRAAGFNATADALAATGIDFGNSRTQEKIDQLGQQSPEVFTAPIVGNLKALGVDARSPWQRAKDDAAEPTVEEVAAEKQSLLAEQFGEELAHRVGAAIRLAAAAGGATEQTIRDAAIAEVG